MNTDELISLLARDAGPAQGPAPQQVGGRLAIALALGCLMVLYMGLNPALREFAGTSPFTLKMIWLFAVLVFSAARRLPVGAPTASVAASAARSSSRSCPSGASLTPHVNRLPAASTKAL